MSNDQHPILHSREDQPTLRDEEKNTRVLVRTRTSSSSSSGLSLKTPRTARFAEATSVNSPIDPSTKGRSPFADPPARTTHLMPQPQPSDVGFGYVADNQPSKHSSYVGVEIPLTPASPLKSALKPPGTPGRLNPLSPTFREEQILEKQEEKTEKEQVKDLKTKTRVRMAKMCLRGVNFSCSLIVLAMLSATFTIFNTTRNLPSKNHGTLNAWSPHQTVWPQITLLCIASVSLVMAIGIIYAYWRGGHRRAEKAAVYYTVFAIGFFIFSIVIWSIGAAILNESKRKNNNNADMWAWSCKDGKRKELYKDDVDYDLVCRMQHWSLICAFIEIIVEVITIAIYGVVFYRYYTKRRLHKSMDLRDRARSDLYLAQLRSQSAPNTPGFQKTPMSPFPSHLQDDPINEAENGEYYGTQYAEKRQSSFAQPKPFALQPPPIRVQHATPSIQQDGFETAPKVNEHVPAAPGEQTYDAVPIPGAYASPLASPSFQPGHQSMSLAHAVTDQSRPLSYR
ncbi:MAG: hypothetical protein LQ346_004434 [Caloplaca aetnensis]|nr:MAG: hypothetical protein LQ346_004434 [Caloplaca aetnensis]